MDPQDHSKCLQVCKNLKSEKYKKYNQLFLDPFPLESVPGYLDVVDKKLDITTLQNNLEAGLYKTRKEFFDDASLIFQNAIKYHSNRETKWINKPAKEMLKVVQRELKNMDKRPSKILTKQKAGSLKLKMGIKKKDITASKTPPLGVGVASMGPADGGAAAYGAPAAAPPPKPKVSLKLKTGGAKSKDKANPVKAKPTQPKLKLKISLSKKISSDTAAPPRPASTPPVPSHDDVAKSSSASKSDKPPKTQQIRLTGPRGKELPKGVTAPSAPPTKKSTTTTKTVKLKTTTPKVGTTKTTATGKTSKKTGTKKTTTKKVKKAAAAVLPPPASSSAAAPVGGAASMMTPIRKMQCQKIISGLKRRKHKSINWFLLPVSDKNIIADYRAKIKHPMCISTMQNKLDRNEYNSVAQFVLDVRRIFANCLR